jgi:hypothetical protein
MKPDREKMPIILRRTERGLEPRSRLAADALAQYALHSDVEISIKKRRSAPQLRLYWAMLHELAEHAWIEGNQYSAEAWHHYLAGRFLGYMETPGGRAPLTTSGLSVGEFNDYMQAVQVMAASELGIGLSLDDV